ncbi:MAG: hypothetical protein JWM88_2973 [Verrucomicrobia bacterium]|nr:hypothetical protein [Verrucomicrobiota bacterium]
MSGGAEYPTVFENGHPALNSPAKKLDRIAWLLLPFAAIGVAVAAWSAFRSLPHWSWSANRLAASVRLAYGFPLYTGPGGVAMSDWFYGPVAAIAYLPAALASDPLGALRIAAALNGLYFLLPLGVVFGGAQRGASPAWTRWAGLIFVTGAFLLPFGLWYGAASLHVDTVTIALGIISCAALVRFDRLPLAAALCVLAAWTKQTDFPLAFAQLIFLARVRGGRAAKVYFGWLAGWAALATAVFCAWFGAGTLWHDLIVLPMRFPIETERIGIEFAAVARNTWWIPPVVFAAWKWPCPPSDERAARDLQLGWLLCLASVMLLPLGFLAAVKYGGAQNSVHSLAYGILGATTLGLLSLGADRRRWGWVGPGLLLAGALAVAGLNAKRVLATGSLDRKWIGEQHREAFEFAKAHPHQAYFPWDPLVTLMAERRVYPFECGYHDYLIAREAPPPAVVRRAFPETLAYLAYFRADQPPMEIPGLFPEFSHRRVIGNWTIYSRPADNATP